MPGQSEDGDWEITDEGLYIATRGFLIRRGYCCGNRCRNCPYINWRLQSTWEPVPTQCLQRRRVTAKVLAGASSLLQYHQQQLQTCTEKKKLYHQTMIEHYQALLKHWMI